MEQDLKAHGVIASGAESANAIRVTLSENARERLWVAEVVEGSETHVAMVHVDASIDNGIDGQCAHGAAQRKDCRALQSDRRNCTGQPDPGGR